MGWVINVNFLKTEHANYPSLQSEETEVFLSCEMSKNIMHFCHKLETFKMYFLSYDSKIIYLTPQGLPIIIY